MKIAYEPHPVTLERKAELRAAGFKIIDARFSPDDCQPELPMQGKPKRNKPRNMEGKDGQEAV